MAKSLHEAPSLSKSALLLSPCSTWAGPQAAWYDEEYTGDSEDMSKRDFGTLFHNLMDQYITGTELGKSLFSKVWPPGMARVLRHAVDYLEQSLGPRCDTIQSEVAIGINWTTGEAEIQQGVKDRKYARKPGWQYGTADLVCVLKTGELLIADWKTGGKDGADEQLLSLAAGFRLCMPAIKDDTMSFRPIRILCLQVNEEGMWPHEREVSQEQIESHWDSMRFAWEDVGKNNAPVPGIHCTTLYCPHLAYCTAIQDVVSGLAGADVEGSQLVSANDLVRNHRVTDTPSSNEEAGFTAAMLSAAKRQTKYLETKLKAYVASGGSVVQGGYVWSEGGNGWRWRKG